MTEVTLTVEQRGVLENLVRNEIGSLGEQIGGAALDAPLAGDADALEAQVARGAFLASVLRSTERGVLEANPATFAMLRRHREDTAARFDHDCNALRAVSSDEREEDNKELEEHVELGRAEIDTCDALLRCPTGDGSVSAAESTTTFTFTVAEADLMRSALAERWHKQAKYAEEEVSDTLSGGTAVSLQDAAWKVREMNTLVDVFDKLGWPGEGAI